MCIGQNHILFNKANEKQSLLFMNIKYKIGDLKHHLKSNSNNFKPFQNNIFKIKEIMLFNLNVKRIPKNLFPKQYTVTECVRVRMCVCVCVCVCKQTAGVSEYAS